MGCERFGDGQLGRERQAQQYLGIWRIQRTSFPSPCTKFPLYHFGSSFPQAFQPPPAMCSDEYFCVQSLANTRSRENERSWSDYLERKLNISFPPRSRIAHFPWLQCNMDRALESQVYCCMWGVKRPVSSWAQLDSRMLALGPCGTWQKGFLHSKAAEQWFLNISSISILPRPLSSWIFG